MTRRKLPGNIQTGKKIMLFGGAFDPPHLGHKRVVEEVLKQGLADEVWLVPVFKHPWAQKYDKFKLAPYNLRVKMIEDMFLDSCLRRNDRNKIKVAHFKDISFTYPTFLYFQKKHPEVEFSWLMGSEYISRFDKFLEGHPKLINYKFYVYPRAGYKLENLFPNMIPIENVNEVNISSSEIREKVKNHRKAGSRQGGDKKGIKRLVGQKVADLIRENNLYK